MIAPTIITLRRTRKLLTPREAWTQGDLALDADGNSVSPDDDRACSWCLLGATEHVAINYHLSLSADIALGATLGADVDEWNDAPERKHAEVLDLIDRTIARLEATQPTTLAPDQKVERDGDPHSHPLNTNPSPHTF